MSIINTVVALLTQAVKFVASFVGIEVPVAKPGISQGRINRVVKRASRNWHTAKATRKAQKRATNLDAQLEKERIRQMTRLMKVEAQLGLLNGTGLGRSIAKMLVA